MTGDHFTTALTTLGLDNHQAAQWLGVSVKSVRRYRVSGAPGPVAGMVRLAVRIAEAMDKEPMCKAFDNYDQMYFQPLALDWRE